MNVEFISGRAHQVKPVILSEGLKMREEGEESHPNEML